MKASLECVYKGIKETKAGSFKNTNGETVQFGDTYKIRVDQLINGLPKELEIKLSKDKALNCAKNFKIYDKIIIDFDIIMYSSSNIAINISTIRNT